MFTPTLTGLGERSHLAPAEIGLDVHVNDVVNVLKYEDLRDVVLVGHSSSGVVITGVADRAPDRIAHVVYLDAFVPEHGQSVFDLVAPDRRQAMEALVKTEGKGWLLPRFAPPAWETIVRDMWGVTDDRRRALDAGSFRADAGSAFQGSCAPHESRRREAPACLCSLPAVSKPPLRPACRDGAADRALALSRLASSHHPPVTMPEKVADLLMDLAA